MKRNLRGEAFFTAAFARAWPRLRAEAVFFLPNHLPGVEAGGESEDVPALALLSGDGAS